MLNFLPQKNRKRIIFEYALRFTSFLLLIIFISSLILISLFAPSYFFVKYKNDTINNQLISNRQKSLDKNNDPIAFIKNVNRLSVALSDNNNSNVTYSDIVKKIVSFKNKDIKILSINITDDNAGGKKILLNGIANTRDGLTSYAEDVKIDGFFKSVVFPVSNFIKSFNSEFSATLIL